MSNYKVTVDSEISIKVTGKSLSNISSSMLRDYISKVKDTGERIRVAWKEEIEKEVKIGLQEFGTWQRTNIKELFESSVNTFYGAYSPKYYKRKGSNNLRSVLDLKPDDMGILDLDKDNEHRGLYNEDKLHPDRNGGSLFEKVFVEGYHGGAEGISSAAAEYWGAHPNPGTPYYRRGGYVKTKEGTGFYHPYAKWGRPAVKTKSIYKMMIEGISTLNDVEEFKTTITSHVDAATKRIKDDMSKGKFYAQ